MAEIIECQCKICNIRFYIKQWMVKYGRGIYCSRNCQNRKIVNRVCRLCKKEFYKSPAQVNNGEGKYCSYECYGLSKLKGKKQFCLTCQKEYYVSLADLKRKSDKYCSKKCYGVAVSKRQLGINNHHYKHGLSNTKEYKNQLQYNNRAKRKEAIGQFTIEEWQLLKEQHNFTCHMCKKSEPEIKLTVDHIIPLTKNGTNFISNIQPLCKSCNSRKSNKIISRINICQKLDRAVDQVILEH